MTNIQLRISICGALLLSLVPALGDTTAMVKWSKFVVVAGQVESVPEQWLQEDEARIAHGIRLPAVVAKTTPFNFELAGLKSWLPWFPDVGRQYFDHLCDTEAGEWLLRTATGQSGLYNARPMRQYSASELQARYVLEAPVLQRGRQNKDTIDSGTYFVSPPFLTYEFVEEPRRAVAWQAEAMTAYIRLFGYRVRVQDTDLPSHPMEMVGIEQLTARYAFTWRGTKRVRDRESSVSGVELIVYDRQSGDVLAVRRQFIYAPPYEGRPETNSWAQGEVCRRLASNSYGGEDVVRLPLLSVPPKQPLTRYVEPLLKAPLPPRAPAK